MSPWLVTMLAPLYRYSYSRDAYVLRGVGSKRGPVLTKRRPTLPVGAPAPEPEQPANRFAREEPQVPVNP